MNRARDLNLYASLDASLGGEFFSHDTVNHGDKEYARGDIGTNVVEGYYSIFKRGMKGVYQHCAEKHLHRYLSEFDFRYSNRVSLGVSDGEVRTLPSRARPASV